MFDRPIKILRYKELRDEFNDRTLELHHIAFCYAQKTEVGGRENLYGSRIVHENEVVYTIRYRSGIEPGMVIDDNDLLLKITSVHEEGRRWRLHLKARKTDAQD